MGKPTGFKEFNWQDGSKSPTYIAKETGLYFIAAKNYCDDKYSDSIKIIVTELPVINLGNDTSIFINKTIVLNAGNGFSKYLWSTGSKDNSITVAPPANIWLKVTDKNNCIGTDTIQVFAKEYPNYIYIPNAFTPNDDGNNDIFKPIVSGIIEEYKFSIYNRFGQLVFSSAKINNGWDGKIDGKPQDTGIFIWICAYKFLNEKKELKKGSVILLK